MTNAEENQYYQKYISFELKYMSMSMDPFFIKQCKGLSDVLLLLLMLPIIIIT